MWIHFQRNIKTYYNSIASIEIWGDNIILKWLEAAEEEIEWKP